MSTMESVITRTLKAHKWTGTRCTCRHHSRGTHDVHVWEAVTLAVAAAHDAGLLRCNDRPCLHGERASA